MPSSFVGMGLYVPIYDIKFFVTLGSETFLKAGSVSRKRHKTSDWHFQQIFHLWGLSHLRLLFYRKANFFGPFFEVGFGEPWWGFPSLDSTMWRSILYLWTDFAEEIACDGVFDVYNIWSRCSRVGLLCCNAVRRYAVMLYAVEWLLVVLCCAVLCAVCHCAATVCCVVLRWPTTKYCATERGQPEFPAV